MKSVCQMCQKLESDEFYRKPSGELYHRCGACGFVGLDPAFFLTSEEEFKRYLTHQNDVEDPGYQNFLKPVVQEVLQRQRPEDRGLDYGCGPHSVVIYLLKKEGFDLQGYDPFFKSDSEKLTVTYDFVVCTEVIEHFLNPLRELDKLQRLLKPGGHLYFKTSLVDLVSDFAKWHYHRDPTHVSFYSRKSLELWAQQSSFQVLDISESKIVFCKN